MFPISISTSTHIHRQSIIEIISPLYQIHNNGAIVPRRNVENYCHFLIVTIAQLPSLLFSIFFSYRKNFVSISALEWQFHELSVYFIGKLLFIVFHLIKSISVRLIRYIFHKGKVSAAAENGFKWVEMTRESSRMRNFCFLLTLQTLLCLELFNCSELDSRNYSATTKKGEEKRETSSFIFSLYLMVSSIA